MDRIDQPQASGPLLGEAPHRPQDPLEGLPEGLATVQRHDHEAGLRRLRGGAGPEDPPDRVDHGVAGDEHAVFRPALAAQFTTLPVLALAVLLVGSRSLALTVQVSVIVAVLSMVGFYIVVTDPVAFWQPYLTTMMEIARQSNLELNAE